MIYNIQPDSEAAELLQDGDEVVTVNEVLTDHLSHASVVRIMCRRPNVRLALRRNGRGTVRSTMDAITPNLNHNRKHTPMQPPRRLSMSGRVVHSV